MKRIEIIYIKSRSLLEAQWYPIATMIGQSLGSIIVTIECLWKYKPHFYCDTTGCAFAFPIAYFSGCQVLTYVHYPTISSDMLQQVIEKRPSFNNNSYITHHTSISIIKQFYYRLFSYSYSYVGMFARVVMVNSSWTQGHISSLWNLPITTSITNQYTNTNTNNRQLYKVYPPCNTLKLLQIPIYPKSSKSLCRQKLIISIGQFRPEKDHLLQLK